MTGNVSFFFSEQIGPPGSLDILNRKSVFNAALFFTTRFNNGDDNNDSNNNTDKNDDNNCRNTGVDIR